VSHTTQPPFNDCIFILPPYVVLLHSDHFFCELVLLRMRSAMGTSFLLCVEVFFSCETVIPPAAKGLGLDERL